MTVPHPQTILEDATENDIVQSIQELKEKYDKGQNISKYLRESNTYNTQKIVEIAYDLQAGSYYENYLHDGSVREYYINAAKEIFAIIHSLCPNAQSILEAGIGEGNFIKDLLDNFDDEVEGAGFDIGWSRVAYARMYLSSTRHKNIELFTGDLLNIPCAENSFDIVYTSHAIEPNHKNEEKIIHELYRITKKYMILREPCYELASDDARKRMDANGYVKGIESILKKNGYDIVDFKLSAYIRNPLNPSAIWVVKKGGDSIHDFKIACPQFKCKLEKIDGAFYSDKGMKVYPIIGGIPCLRIDNGILASKYGFFAKK